MRRQGEAARHREDYQIRHPDMEIKRDNPERRKYFRARPGCDTEAVKNKMTAKC